MVTARIEANAVMELDEIWHYVKKRRKLWRWKALQATTGRCEVLEQRHRG
jgi:hypothetical protein